MTEETVPVLFSARLNWEELLLLDGRCQEAIQRDIDLVKEGQLIQKRYALTMAGAVFIARVKREAIAKGKLICRHVQMHYCPVTGLKLQYEPTGKKDRWGAKKPDREILVTGYELQDSFVSVKDHPRLGISTVGLDLIRPYLASELRDIPAEVPDKLIGEVCQWVRVKKLKCVCGWHGRETQIVNRNPFWFGKQCPACKERESAQQFTSKLFSDDGYEVVSRVTLEQEAIEAKAEYLLLEKQAHSERRQRVS
jgi:hypothetical protein